MLDEIISILNKKGYYVDIYHGVESAKYFTVFELLPFIEKNNAAKDRLEIVGISSINVIFKENYDFENIPLGYRYIKDIKNLAKLIYLYEDSPFNLKGLEDIKKEEENNLQLLKDWAEKLPERKDDKNE